LRKLLKLFISTLTLSAFTFGGGYVIISLMKRTFVDDLGWLTEDEMLDMTAIAQSAPGPVAVNASMIVGFRVAGAAGAVVAVLGTVLPPLVLLSIISVGYEAFSSHPMVAAVLKGMQAGVAAVICDVVLNMGGKILAKKDVVSTLLMIAAFAVTCFTSVNVVFVILVCGAIGALRVILARKAGEDHE